MVSFTQLWLIPLKMECSTFWMIRDLMLHLCKNKTKNLDIKFVEHFALLKKQVMPLGTVKILVTVNTFWKANKQTKTKTRPLHQAVIIGAPQDAAGGEDLRLKCWWRMKWAWNYEQRQSADIERCVIVCAFTPQRCLCRFVPSCWWSYWGLKCWPSPSASSSSSRELPPWWAHLLQVPSASYD